MFTTYTYQDYLAAEDKIALLCKAFCPELPVSVDAACCAGVTPENHRNALSAMQCCQIDVLNIAPDAK